MHPIHHLYVYEELVCQDKQQVVLILQLGVIKPLQNGGKWRNDMIWLKDPHQTLNSEKQYRKHSHCFSKSLLKLFPFHFVTISFYQ